MFSICRKMVLITKELSPLGVPLNRELLEVVKKIKAKKKTENSIVKFIDTYIILRFD